MAKLGAILPLIITFVFVGIVAAVAFVAYSIAHDVGHKTRQKLEKKHVSFSRDGMKVGVKEVTAEEQEDKTQRYNMPHSIPRELLHKILGLIDASR